MGGNDSQKLLPWRGMYSSPGRKLAAHGKIDTLPQSTNSLSALDAIVPARRDATIANAPTLGSRSAYLLRMS